MEEMTINSTGGRQHKVEERCEALFPKAILAVARLRKEGFERHGYEDDNYINIHPREHIGRALRHLLLWLDCDTEDGTVDEHLVHAACRTLMALEIVLENKKRARSELEQLRLEYGYEPDENL